ncbi:MAG: hypothetical protein NTY38_25740, partial [Acidobacteria bacterium]|nr:hypothetical protein [Acidobacteriota bacterium]
AVAWPLERNATLEPAPVLSPENDGFTVIWTLSAEQSAGLVSGPYVVSVSWAGVRARPISIELADPPAELTGQERTAIAVLRIEVALLRNEPQTALAVAISALIEDPASIALLVQKARAHEALGELPQALASTHAALERFKDLFPALTYPPLTILNVHNRLLDRIAEQAAQ